MADTHSRSGFPFASVVGDGQQSGTLVEHSDYRECNLNANNIFMQELGEALPPNVAELITSIRQNQNTSTITRAEVLQDSMLQGFIFHGAQACEEQVDDYFRREIIPTGDQRDCLQRDLKKPMRYEVVPNTALNGMRVSTPIPDVLYGYDLKKAFPHQRAHILLLVQEVKANNSLLLYPFFTIKFKGDRGSMWAATNQCLGAATSCVNLIEDLNHRLKCCGSSKVIENTAFSIATNGTEARLYATWKQDELYKTAPVQCFLLQDPQHHVEFRRWIYNILHWGRNERLKELHEAIDILLEEGRKRTSETAKSRVPPASNSAAQSRNKRRKVMTAKPLRSSTARPGETRGDTSEEAPMALRRSKRLHRQK
ncbi:hypothetical protein EDB81DRAFT_634757 [Dactylonectria macrodidyma]|uniref:DUF7924 domain-containing protein n=1 Tax=Dactylonectria macrodidyma TaxID=307937 RepID=A0A9P9FTH7_9HYPO|nr:hypothetical protein EDB81DRAFT_634757 [Dactylonectria macrodidyma]